MHLLEKMWRFLGKPHQSTVAEILRFVMRVVVHMAFQTIVIIPWVGAVCLIKSAGFPESLISKYMAGILFGVTLLGFLYVNKIIRPMVHYYPRLIEDASRCFYYWRITLPVFAVITFVTGAKLFISLVQ